MLTPAERYQTFISTQQLLPDAFQADVIQVLQGLFEQIVQQSIAHKKDWFSFVRQKKSTAAWQGLYLWGGVGRGKTLLVDLFFDCLPLKKKWRVHFHHLMKNVHQSLFLLKQEKNPLKKIAQQMAHRAHVICIDEFFVSDITDAMILAELLKRLLEQGVTLVFTSNTPPDGLYLNGLQRAKFLPTIALIESRLQVRSLDSPVDYRLRVLETIDLYYYPITGDTEQKMLGLFQRLAPGVTPEPVTLDVDGRAMTAYAVAPQVVWLDFKTLFVEPRGVSDYIELAQTYHTVMVSHVAPMGEQQEDVARRFVAFIDECYDHGVKVVMLGQVPYAEVYHGSALIQPFQRTLSRLQEMQSHAYLLRPHKILGAVKGVSNG